MKRLLIITMLIAFRLVVLADDRPNIIFFLIDDQRYDLLSMLDHPFIETPHIDKLAKGGVYFDEAFVTTSLAHECEYAIPLPLYIL